MYLLDAVRITSLNDGSANPVQSGLSTFEKNTRMGDEFEQRFKNWMAWCRGRHYFERSQAGSVEGRYRSPQRNVWDPPDPNMRILEPVKNYDALLVNRAFWQLGEKTRRTIIVLWFRSHWREQWKAQKIGCHYTELGEVGYRAKKMLANRLDSLEQKAYRRT